MANAEGAIPIPQPQDRAEEDPVENIDPIPPAEGILYSIL